MNGKQVRHASHTRHPVNHDGRYHNIELVFNENPENLMHLAVPARKNLQSSMCLCYELIRLSRGSQPYDTVIAWGAFPLCDSSQRLNQGRFKVPLLRGAMSPTVDKYKLISSKIEKNIDNWLCNMYVTVQALPRIVHGQNEYI